MMKLIIRAVQELTIRLALCSLLENLNLEPRVFWTRWALEQPLCIKERSRVSALRMIVGMGRYPPLMLRWHGKGGIVAL